MMEGEKDKVVFEPYAMGTMPAPGLGKYAKLAIALTLALAALGAAAAFYFYIYPLLGASQEENFEEAPLMGIFRSKMATSTDYQKKYDSLNLLLEAATSSSPVAPTPSGSLSPRSPAPSGGATPTNTQSTAPPASPSSATKPSSPTPGGTTQSTSTPQSESEKLKLLESLQNSSSSGPGGPGQ
ncbi:hypothetical protein KW797_00560 [Candidatus Parcubacteria bacterium]|nr:hypothetical protein [Candidatus Parcubacteria bacterium]